MEWIRERYNKDFYLTKHQKLQEFNSIIEAFYILCNRSTIYDNKNGPKQIIAMSKYIIDYYEKNNI